MCEFFLVELEPASPSFDRLLSRLDPEERERVLAQKHPAARRRSLSVRLLVRLLACERLGAENTALRFAHGPKGKPYLTERPGFQFSLAHTENAVAAAVSGRAVGVDVERLRPAKLELAGRFFTPAEQAHILAGLDQDARFFDVWTRKEACVKYTGEGLSTPLPSFDVLSGEWAERLVSFRQGEWMAACCCEEKPDALQILPEAWLLEQALTLTPFPE